MNGRGNARRPWLLRLQRLKLQAAHRQVRGEVFPGNLLRPFRAARWWRSAPALGEKGLAG
jgi:hypothetical protein